jgi:hypothetical protein
MPYIVFGDVRGLVSEHRVLMAARQSRRHDHAACASLPSGNSYSDCKVYFWTDEGSWCPDVTDEGD